MGKRIAQQDMAKEYPEAFKALPSVYQADSCLTFFKRDDRLFCRPLEDQRPILGSWLCIYVPMIHAWIEVKVD